MNKTIAMIGAFAVGAASLSAQNELSISSTFGWESKYVFRGQELAEEIFTPSIDFSYGGAYAGIWAALPVDGEYGNEVDFYAGYALPLGENFNLDVGATYYTYPDAGDDFFDGVNTFEVYAGTSFDVLLSPALYVYYDFDTENLTFEGSIGYSIPVSDMIAIDFGAYLGWVNIGKHEEFQVPEGPLLRSPRYSDYTYYGASADVVFTLTENATLSAGVRWAGSTEDTFGDFDFDEWDDFLEDEARDDDNAFWWGVALTVGF